MNVLNEEHGTLTVEQIRSICTEVFQEYPIEFGLCTDICVISNLCGEG